MISNAIRFGLGLAGMSEAQVNDLDAKLPGAQRVAAACKLAEPELTAVLPLLEQAEPHLAKIYAILKPVYPDIVASTPTIENLLEWVQSK